jgi:membrane fusion protein (multidrug efflux system)
LRQGKALAETTAKLAVSTVEVVSPSPAKVAANLMLPAQVQPWIEAPIYAQVSGYLKNWTADIGAHITRGQLLAVIETPELDQQLDQARHQLTEQQAALSLAKLTAARYAELIKTASVSEQDNAEKQANLEVAEASVAAAQANVRRIEYTQSFARVTAPFTGTISARTVDVGQLVSANATQLFRLSQTNKLRVYVNVPQAQAFGVKPGYTTELSIPGFPGHPIKATVVATANQISDASRTLLAQLEVDNSAGQILAGSFGQVKWSAAKGKPALTLPESAVMFGADGTRVEVVSQDGTVAAQSVKLGWNLGTMFEILAGVTPEDRVIVNPFDWLVGEKVNVVTAEVMKQEQSQ